ncbi:MAG: PAS domain S-box protein [Thermodesulfobacteriota bacterium]
MGKEELTLTKEYMKSLINCIVDPMVTTDLRGIITFLGEGTEEFLGYKNEEAIGRHISLFYKDGKEEAKRIMRALEKDGRIKNYEIVFISKDGREIPTLVSISFLRDAKGEITGTLGMARDISKMKRMEDALREREEFFSGTLNDMLTFVGVLEPTGKLIFVNNTPLLAAGIKLEDVVGKMFYDTYWWAYSEEAREVIKENIEACASGKTLVQEIQAHMADSLIWIEFSMHPIYDEKGKVKYLVPEGRDITERKRTENELKETRDFLERILESSTDSIVVTNMDGKITFANSGTKRMFGYGKEEVFETHISQYYAGGLEEAKRIGKIVKKEGRLHFGELDFIKKDRTPITLSMSYDLLRDKEGRAVGIVAIGKDVTEKKRIEIELRKIKDFLESVIEGSIDGITTLDNKGNITLASKGAEEMLGYKRGNILDTHISKYYVGGMGEARKIMKLVRKEGKLRNYETALITKDGRTIPISVSVSFLRDDKGEIISSLGIYKDITENKKLQKELEKLSITDNLTGLYNQRHFYNELKREVERAKRLKHPLSLLLFDVDRFKYYNDTYGHLEGDKVLYEVGKVVANSIRENVDSGYRYGGDEFVVVLPETDKDQALPVAERIRTSFNNNGLVDVTFSIGLVEYRLEYDLETFVRHADNAMYTAKRLGGDRITIHE